MASTEFVHAVVGLMAQQVKTRGLAQDLSSSTEEGTDSESDASSAGTLKKSEPLTAEKKTPVLVIGGKSGAVSSTKPVVVKSGGDAALQTKRNRSASEEVEEHDSRKKKRNGDSGKVVEEVESSKKKAAAAEKEAETRKRKAAKTENGVDKAPPQKISTRKERKVSAEKTHKDDGAKEVPVQKNGKDKSKPMVVGKDAPAVDKRAGKGSKQARDAEVLAEESPKATPPQKQEVPGDSTPVKAKNSSHWTFEDETAFSVELLSHMKPGQPVSAGKGDGWFLQLVRDVEGKLDGRFSKEQLSDKIRRMNSRYNQLVERIKDPNALRKFKNPNEEKLFNNYWKKIWGPVEPPAKALDESSSSSEDESEDGEEEQSAGLKPPPPINSEESSDEYKGKGGEEEEEEEEDDDDDDDKEDELNEAERENGDVLKDSPMSPEPAKRQDVDDLAGSKPRTPERKRPVQPALAEAPVSTVLKEAPVMSAMDVDTVVANGRKQADAVAPPQGILNSNTLAVHVPKHKLVDKKKQGQAESEAAATTTKEVAMDLDLVVADDKEEADVTVPPQDTQNINVAALLARLGSKIDNLESKLESSRLAAEQMQQKTLFDDVKVYQNRVSSLVDHFGARVSMPMLGGFGSSSIPGILGGGLGVPRLTSSNGYSSHEEEYLKLQQQWRDLEMDELECVSRRIQLVQESLKLQQKLQNSDSANA